MDYKNNEVADDGYIYAAIDGFKYKLKDNLAIGYRQYYGEYDNVVIPEQVTYKGITYTVNEIVRFAFAGYTVKNLTIPKSVTEIGDKAFTTTDTDSITFTGTMEEWKAVKKEVDWKVGKWLPINCSDGVFGSQITI